MQWFLYLWQAKMAFFKKVGVNAHSAPYSNDTTTYYCVSTRSVNEQNLTDVSPITLSRLWTTSTGLDPYPFSSMATQLRVMLRQLPHWVRRFFYNLMPILQLPRFSQGRLLILAVHCMRVGESIRLQWGSLFLRYQLGFKQKLVVQSKVFSTILDPKLATSWFT